MNSFLFLKISSLLRYLLNLKIKYRKIYFIFCDLLLLTFSYVSSLWLLDLGYNIKYKYFLFFLFFTSLYLVFGNYYKNLTRYSSSLGFYKLAIKNTLLIISIQIVFKIFENGRTRTDEGRRHERTKGRTDERTNGIKSIF